MLHDHESTRVLNVQSNEGRSIKHKGKKQQEKMRRIFIKSVEFRNQI